MPMRPTIHGAVDGPTPPICDTTIFVSDPRKLLSENDARALLALPKGHVLPPEEVLLRDAARIIETNLALAKELVPVAEQGLQPSPIWEPKQGVTHVRMAVLPPVFRGRYFDGEGAQVLAEPVAIQMVVDVLPWMTEDPVGAAFALENTYRAWHDDTAPNRSLDLPYEGHFRLLSLLLADIARKGAAGLDTLEWLGSIGLPIDESRDPDDPPEEAIRASMKVHLDAMWAEERAWRREAFGR